MSGFALDSYAVIAYLEGERGADTVREVLESCAAHDRPAVMCIVNWGEVYYQFLREAGEQVAALVLSTMQTLPIELVDVDRELTLRAARYKAFHKLSYADAFAAALAHQRKAELVTGDKEFRALADEVKIRWL